MNRKLILALLAAVLPLGLLAMRTAPAPSRDNQPDALRTLSVTGSGEASAAPDLAELQIYVSASDTDAGTAVDEASAKLQSVIEALKKLGVDEKDIHTAEFCLCGEQDYDSMTGYPEDTYTYTAHHTLDVSLRDLTKVGAVLSGALHAGAISVSGVYFTVSDLSRLEAEARANAVADARARAEQLALAAGVTLDQPLTLSEATGDYYSGYEGDYGYSELPSNVSTVAGRIQVAVQVSVVYSIK